MFLHQIPLLHISLLEHLQLMLKNINLHGNKTLTRILQMLSLCGTENQTVRDAIFDIQKTGNSSPSVMSLTQH